MKVLVIGGAAYMRSTTATALEAAGHTPITWTGDTREMTPEDVRAFDAIMQPGGDFQRSDRSSESAGDLYGGTHTRRYIWRKWPKRAGFLAFRSRRLDLFVPRRVTS
jgi:hypothetical protein